MSACFLPALSEVIRLTTPDVGDDPEITVTLDPVTDQGNRSRVGARFWVAVSLSWAVDPWGSGVQVVDARGYPVVWKYADVAKWLVKALSGTPCVVTVTITDAAHVPARWTDARITAAEAKVADIDAADFEAAAAAKVLSVSAWSNSQRKRDVIAAAENMNEAAGLLRIAQEVQGGGTLEGGGGGGGGGGGSSFETAEYLSPGATYLKVLNTAKPVHFYRMDLGAFNFALSIYSTGDNPLGGAVQVRVFDDSRQIIQSYIDYGDDPVPLSLNGPGFYFVSVDSFVEGEGVSVGGYLITLSLV